MALLSRPIRCRCGAGVYGIDRYEAHVRTHYPPKEKPFKCEICDKYFGSQSWLTRHSKIHSVHIQVIGYESSVTDIFTIFPREIWCMILENVPYFRDRLRIFQAYPELEGFYKKKKQLCLFDQVVPHIAEWTGGKDLLSCRLVARQWTMGVDNFLENHPSRRTYPQDEADQQSMMGPVWDWHPINYSKCYHGQSFDNNSIGNFLYRKYFDRAYSFGFYNIYRFLLEREWHQVDINPFVGRSIVLVLDIKWEDKNNRPLCESMENFRKNFLKNIHALLNKWGRHIWFLKIVMTLRELLSETEFVNFLQTSLACLPNLKSLDLDLETGYSWRRHNYVNISLPSLPHLETLQISRIPFCDPLVTQMLLPQYSQQIRRVHLKLQYDDSILASTSLPNLRELLITYMDDRTINDWKNEVDNVLSSIEAPQLCSLAFRDWKYPLQRSVPGDLPNINIYGWLHKFPCLRHLYLPDLNGVGAALHYRVLEGTRSAQAKRICSPLESICLHINTLRCSRNIFDFLPSLQCLQIFANLPWIDDLENEEESFRICNDTLKLDREWGVFENLQNLKIIIILNWEYEDGPRYRFSKVAVEKYLRKMGAIE